MLRFCSIVVCWVVAVSVARAEAPAVLPDYVAAKVAQPRELRTLDSYFPLQVPESAEAWAKRAELIRRRILVANGLYPMPEPTPAHAVVRGLVDRGEYTVERVSFESFPGHFVTGSLYRPKHRSGRMPAVLCPHGHWADGRFYDAGEEAAKKDVAAGGEFFLNAARYPLQARCVQLARMGCVVFHYDMLGNADSQQISVEIAHGFRDRRPEMEGKDAWGFFSPQAELRLQSIMGLQTYNSIRALDFLCTLPDVDPARIGVTGASGGGTQSFILAAIDPRVSVAFPAVMVSTAMQGGCTCENCCYLRTGVGNVDFAACFAPKPLGLTAANDWTKELETKGLPELKQLYALLGAPGQVEAAIHLEFGHNYNGVSGRAMYAWFQKHLGLDAADQAVVERDFQPLSVEEMAVWDDAHPRPEAGPAYERKLTRVIADASEAAFAADPQRFTRNAYEVIIDRDFPQKVFQGNTIHNERGNCVEIGYMLETYQGEHVAQVKLEPKNRASKWTVLWFDGHGKAGLYDENDTPILPVARLLSADMEVIGADLIGQGELKGLVGEREENRRVEGDRNFAGYTYGYNSPLFVQRVHDIMTVASLAHYQRQSGERIALVGVNGAGPWVAAAMVEIGDGADAVAIDTKGFRFADLSDYAAPQFVPGAVKYGDLPGLLHLLGKRPVWLAGEGSEYPKMLEATLGNAQAGGVSGPKEKAEENSSALVDWLLLQAAAGVAK